MNNKVLWGFLGLTLILGSLTWLAARTPVKRHLQTALPSAAMQATGTTGSPTRIIYYISTNPAALSANQPTTVTIVARLGNDLTLIPESVVVNKYNMAGSLVGPLGRMYDDGTHGDANANDNVFTATIILNEPKTVTLEVSAAYRGSLRRITERKDLLIHPATITGRQTLIVIADAVDRGDFDEALRHMYVKSTYAKTLLDASPADRTTFTSFLRAATLEKSDGQHETFRGTYQGVSREIFLSRSVAGDWLLVRW